MKDLRGPWKLEYCDGWYVVDGEGDGVCDIGGFGIDDRLHAIGQAIEALPEMIDLLEHIAAEVDGEFAFSARRVLDDAGREK